MGVEFVSKVLDTTHAATREMRDESGGVASSSSSALPDVAVCFSGWLSVRVPKRGALARQHLIDVLSADVLVAGTYLPSDCRGTKLDSDGSPRTCLLRRLEALRPLARVEIDPMLDHSQLHKLVSASPNWPRVQREFRADNKNVHRGVTIWAPLLGNGNLSVLRELHDYSRAYQLLERHEKTDRKGQLYRRVVFSRLEFEWLGSHPPLSLLPSGIGGSNIWLPSGGVAGGFNDRHALMDRAAAPTYFKRWELLLSPNLFNLVKSSIILEDGPEMLLKAALSIGKLHVRYFPSTMVLGCCSKRSKALGRCFGSTVCIERELRLSDGTLKVIGAKYFDELKFAERHSAALACPGAHYASAGRIAAERLAKRDAGYREASVVIALPMPRLSRWHPDPRVGCDDYGGLSKDGKYAHLRCAKRRRGTMDNAVRVTLPMFTTFMRVEPTNERSQQVTFLQRLRTAARAAYSHCPMMPRHWWPFGAVGGYCSETTSEGNCSIGDKGSFGKFEARGMFKGEVLSIAECAKMCSRCPRCKYFSVAMSADVVDCSWYHSCDLTQTKQLPHANFVSMSLVAAARYTYLCRVLFGREAC